MRKILTILLAVSLFMLTMSSCKKNSDSSSVPAITPNSAVTQVIEDATSGSADLAIVLSGASAKDVSIDYITADSTAIAGKDYIAESSGKLTFKPGELSKNIKINIIQDTARKQDVYFKVILSNPVNGNLVKTTVIVKIINVDYSTLVWSDEFNGNGLNTSFWNYELGSGGWGNNELETYTNSVNNVHLDTGKLHITALNPSAGYYTSGRITTKGKKEFTNFRVDIRARAPEGKGIWPALWALGGNISTVNWPKCGEIDIMELLGHAPSIVYGTLHWDNNGHVSTGNSFSLNTGKFSSGYHKFSLIWTPNKIRWFIDNRQYFYVSRGEASLFPFDLPQFFIFNVAVGGNWPGSPDQTTVFPQNMIVDYIRVYQ